MLAKNSMNRRCRVVAHCIADSVAFASLGCDGSTGDARPSGSDMANMGSARQRGAGRMDFPGAEQNLSDWGEINSCTGTPAPLTAHPTCEAFPSCADGAQTVLCIQQGLPLRQLRLARHRERRLADVSEHVASLSAWRERVGIATTFAPGTRFVTWPLVASIS
jgi:hypothetical protein